jgi:hypothetical protein
MEAPSINHQNPNNKQTQIFKRRSGNFAFEALVLGACLVIGSWDLELPAIAPGDCPIIMGPRREAVRVAD